ncbi:MAG TPA: hypothetical protein VMC42_01275 [Methanoregulaceae archaeon]|nr:hypothetical protein [Methanoregulaceae archaeon]
MNSFFVITAVILVIAVIALVLIVILLKLYQVKSHAGKGPGAKGRQEMESTARASSGTAGLVQKKHKASLEFESELELRDEGDISKNMKAFVEKYRFDSFTLSSVDGLVIASTSSDSQGDAANYSQSFRNGVQSPEPGTTIFGMSHHGSTIIGIIRSSHPVPIPVPDNVESDANNILKWSL